MDGDQALDEHTNQLRALLQLGMATSAAPFEVSAIVDTVARGLVGVLGDECAVHSQSAPGVSFSAVAYRFNPTTRAAEPVALPEALERLRLEVVRTQRLRASSVRSSEETTRHLPPGQLCIAPMVALGEAMGTITLRRKAGAYTEADQELVRLAADQTALSLWNARRYEEVEQERKRLEEVLKHTPPAELPNRPWLRLREGAPTKGLVPLVSSDAPKSGPEAVHGARWLLRMIFDSFPAVAFLKDAQGRYLFVNRRYEQASFLESTEQILGRTDRELFQEELAHYFETIDREVLQSDQAITTEDKFFVEGEWRVFTAVKFPLRDLDGQVFGTGGIATETTERKHVEHALHRGQEQLRFITDALPALVSFITQEGKVQFANKAHEAWFGLTRDDIMGKPLREVFDESVLSSVVPQFQRALHGRAFSFDARIPHATLGVRDVKISCNPQHDLSQRVEGVVVLMIDFTEQRRAEERIRFLADTSRILATSLEYLSTAKAVAAQAVQRLVDLCAIVMSGDRNMDPIVACSDARQTSSAERLIRSVASDPSSPFEFEKVLASGRPLLQGELTETWLRENVSDTEQRELIRDLGLRSLIIAPIAGRQGRLGAIVLGSTSAGGRSDHADRALAEELGHSIGLAAENALLYAEAQQAVRVRDEFLSIAGHELKTPLTALSLDLDMLQMTLEASDRGETEPRFAKRLHKASQNLERLGELVRELLDVSRLSVGGIVLDTTSLDLGRVVRGAVERFQEHAVEAGCELIITTPQNPVMGVWDPMRLEQVLSNLLSNAIKYGAGKTVEIALESGPTHATIRVKDHGIGIAPADQERIFERFERAVSVHHYGGFGLGLWISRQFVTAMGGSLRVESRSGHGSTFIMELPYASGG